MKLLQVTYQTQHVGLLADTGHARFTFQYAPGWLAAKNAFPISIQLPLQEAVFDDSQCHAFFANLLPEGLERELIEKKERIPERNDFKLLEAIAGECAGALSLSKAGSPICSDGHYERLEHTLVMKGTPCAVYDFLASY